MTLHDDQRRHGSVARYVLTAFLAVAAGGAAGYFLGSGVHTSQHRVLVRRELETLGTVASALEALESQDASTRSAVRILESRLQRSVADLADLTLVHVSLDEPELLQAVRAAERYADAHGMSSTASQARIVAERLGRP